MPSQLYDNSAVDFICARDFTYAGVEYKIGEDFPQEDAGKNLETLVRTRRVIPVVDSRDDKPRHWFREVRVRADVLNKFGNTGEHLLGREKQMELDQPVMPQPELKKNNDLEDEDMATHKVQYVNGREESEPIEMLNLGDKLEDAKVEVKEEEQLTVEYTDEQKKLLKGEVDPEDRDVAPDNSGEPVESFDPSEHSVQEVKDHLDGASHSEQERVLAQERAGKNRKGIVGDPEKEDISNSSPGVHDTALNEEKSEEQKDSE